MGKCWLRNTLGHGWLDAPLLGSMCSRQHFHPRECWVTRRAKIILIHSGGPNHRLYCFAVRQRKIPNEKAAFEVLWEIYNAYEGRGDACDCGNSYYEKLFADGMLWDPGGEAEIMGLPGWGAQGKRIIFSCFWILIMRPAHFNMCTNFGLRSWPKRNEHC